MTTHIRIKIGDGVFIAELLTGDAPETDEKPRAFK